METRNQELKDAVLQDKADLAEAALKDHADPNLIVQSSKTLLFFAQSPEMIVCLLQHGANPAVRDFSTSLLESIYANAKHVVEAHKLWDMLLALIEHRPCSIPNSDINKVLIQLVNKLLVSPDLESKKGKVLLALIRASSNLQENVHVLTGNHSLYTSNSVGHVIDLINYSVPTNPVQHAAEWDKPWLLDLLFYNNSNLCQDLQNDKLKITVSPGSSLFRPLAQKNVDNILKKHKFSISDYFQDEKIGKFVDLMVIANYFDALNIWQLFLFGFRDKGSAISRLPTKLVFSVVTALIPDDLTLKVLAKYLHENSALLEEMQTFERNYNFISKHDKINSKHGFMKDHGHLLPWKSARFFSKVNETAKAEPDRQTAITLTLCKMGGLSSRSNQSIDFLHAYYSQRLWVCPSKDQIREWIKLELEGQHTAEMNDKKALLNNPLNEIERLDSHASESTREIHNNLFGL